MKKKSNIYLIVYLLIAAIIIVVGFLIDKKNKKEAAEAYASSINNMYTRWLYIKGDFSYEGAKVHAKNLEYNDKLLMVDVGYVNYCNENEQFMVEQLYEEYEMFRNDEKREKYKNLNEYVQYIQMYSDAIYDYDKYLRNIYDELEIIREEKEKKGETVIIDDTSHWVTWNNRTEINCEAVKIAGGSSEEIQEAINRVNQRGDLE